MSNRRGLPAQVAEVSVTDATCGDFFLRAVASSSAGKRRDEVASVLTTSVDSDELKLAEV